MVAPGSSGPDDGGTGDSATDYGRKCVIHGALLLVASLPAPTVLLSELPREMVVSQWGVPLVVVDLR